jgi:hypothetical protein
VSQRSEGQEGQILIEWGGGPAAVGPGIGRPSQVSELEPSHDGGDVDAEASGELPARALVVVDGVEDAFSEIVRRMPSFHYLVNVSQTV